MVGGGLSGLFTAVALLSRGIDDLVVVERSDRPGGVAQTIAHDGYLLEAAAGSFTLPHPHLSPILETIGAEVAGAAATARYVYSGWRLIEVRTSPGSLLSPLLPWGAKLRAVAEPLVRRPAGSGDESLGAFSRRRFGAAAGDLLASLLAAGVYAGDPDRLSAASAFPMLTALEEGHGSVVRGALRRRKSQPAVGSSPRPHVPVGGMSALARAAAKLLDHRFRPGLDVQSLRQDAGGWVIEGEETLTADVVVVAACPEHAARLADPELADRLTQVPSAPVAVVGLGGDGPPPFPGGFGALVGEPIATLGLLFESSYAPERSPEGSWLLKAIAGGAKHPDVVYWDDDRLIERVLGDAALILGRGFQPSSVTVVRHLPGIPQPEIGHADWLADVEKLVSDRPGLYLTGWGYRAIGVTHLATDAVRVAESISRRDG